MHRDALSAGARRRRRGAGCPGERGPAARPQGAAAVPSRYPRAEPIRRPGGRSQGAEQMQRRGGPTARLLHAPHGAAARAQTGRPAATSCQAPYHPPRAAASRDAHRARPQSAASCWHAGACAWHGGPVAEKVRAGCRGLSDRAPFMQAGPRRSCAAGQPSGRALRGWWLLPFVAQNRQGLKPRLYLYRHFGRRALHCRPWGGITQRTRTLPKHMRRATLGTGRFCAALRIRR